MPQLSKVALNFFISLPIVTSHNTFNIFQNKNFRFEFFYYRNKFLIKKIARVIYHSFPCIREALARRSTYNNINFIFLRMLQNLISNFLISNITFNQKSIFVINSVCFACLFEIVISNNNVISSPTKAEA